MLFCDNDNDDAEVDDNANYDDNDEKKPWRQEGATHTKGEKEQQREFSCNHCGTEFIVGVKLKSQNDPFCGPQMVTQLV